MSGLALVTLSTYIGLVTRTKRAAIYARISRDSELLGEGVDRQERDCRELADRLGYAVTEVFADNDVSASTSSKKARPRYDAMVQAVRAGRVDVVLAYSNSRLTRRPRELEDLIELHAKTGVQIKTVVSGDDDLSTADGRMVARIKANVDAAEAERTAERVRRALADRAEHGAYTGPRPFGYQFAADASGRVLTGRSRRLVIDPAEAAVIRECVRRVLHDEGLWSIMNDLNRRGIRTSTGVHWRSQPLRRMLLRWTNAGYRKHQEHKDGKWTGPIRLFTGDWEPIIDEKTHERVIAKLTDPSRVSNRGDTDLKYLLTWMAFCGVCGGRLVGAQEYTYVVKGYKRANGTRSASRARTYPARYTCQNPGCHGVTRRMDDVDEFVEKVVVGLLERDGVQVLGGDRGAAEEAHERIAALKARRALLADLLGVPEHEGGLDREQFLRQNAALKAELAAEEARLRLAQPDSELMGFTGDGTTEAWLGADVARKRSVLKALEAMVGLKVTVDPIGSGAFSDKTASRYAGIRVEWEPEVGSL